MVNIKKQIEELLRQKKMTHEQLADEIGVTRMTLWRWREGKNPSKLALKSLDQTMTSMDIKRRKS